LANELGNISSRVAIIEGQSPGTAQSSTIAQEQSLPTTHSVPSSETEQSLLIQAVGSEQSLHNVEDRDTADGAEPQNEDSSREETSSNTRAWDERVDHPDYNEQIFW